MNIVSSALESMDSAIVLAHDIHEPTVFSLASFMIDTAEQQGFELVTLGACMNDPPQNWYRDPETGGPWREGSNDKRDATQSFRLNGGVAGEHSASESIAGILPLSIEPPTTEVDDITALAIDTSTPTSRIKTTGTATQRASTIHPRKDECIESHEEVKPTGTIGENEPESGVSGRVESSVQALLVSFLVVILFLF